jgi:alpha-galactosidase
LLFRFILITISKTFEHVKRSPAIRKGAKTLPPAGYTVGATMKGAPVSHASTTRRRFLKLVAGAGAAPYAFATPASEGSSAQTAGAIVGDGVMVLEFDSLLRSRVAHLHDREKVFLTEWSATESLQLAGGARIASFALETVAHESIDEPPGRGMRLRVCGTGSPAGQDSVKIQKTVEVDLLERYPGFALLKVSYRNASSAPVRLQEWRCADLEMLSPKVAEEPPFWSYCGSTHADRRNWVQPLTPGFHQENFLGMTASDYGGGIPVADVWRRDCGIAVGHLEPRPRLLSLPVRRSARGASIAITGKVHHKLAPGESYTAPALFLAVHSGDYFSVLDSYRRRMAEQGVCPAKPPATAFESIWCAWGYERSCTVSLIEGTLPKVKELGLRWAVVDDGWQNNVGDWKLNAAKYPHGDTQMQALTAKIRSYDLKPRLWIAPLAATPGSDVLHDHPDMLLLNQDGAPQLISWWNAFYLCPAYAKTVTFHEDIVRRILADWGYAGLKLDGQHLNGVAPCYNPAHRHSRPEESLEGLQDFFQSLYAVAMKIDPQTVMELCPCGTGFSFFNLEYANQAPASDPESSWQVRHKGKTLKALMGPQAPFAGDHVELSDGHDDFASTVGIGAIISTKFTWPRDPKPKDSFLLTAERESLWRKWIALYNERMLPQGTYRGELYDLGFDKPEGHVVEKSGRLYYAFFAEHWSGPVMLRGLSGGRYRVRDYFHERELGVVAGPTAPLNLSFERFQVLEALPI